MKHLVTGGGGFLGSHIARRLASGGSAVRLMDIREPRSPGPGTEFIRASILDRNSVREALRGVDVVHHTASLVPVTKAGGNFFEVNVTGSRILAEEAVRAGVRCFVHMSSTAVFGAPERVPLEEDSPMRPVEIFGRTKMEGEAVVGDICRRNGVPLIVLRPRTVLGKGRMG
ncbi:MAG TPA: NAD(P)-dependent oxidoreductase, partial [Elusimicrobiota bacterium]|nr:NAD(P)-dependent oxidoreductase [Elusimicrobiota bacterium]